MAAAVAQPFDEAGIGPVGRVKLSGDHPAQPKNVLKIGPAAIAKS
jgi:hypothetical protein